MLLRHILTSAVLLAVPLPVAAIAGETAAAPDQTVPKAAPRAAQIEPMVAPVKRAVPKVSGTKEKPLARTAKTAKKRGGSADKVIIKKADASAKPVRIVNTVLSKARAGECAKGFKLTDTGNKCVKVVASAGAKTAKVKTAAAKKKHR